MLVKYVQAFVKYVEAATSHSHHICIHNCATPRSHISFR